MQSGFWDCVIIWETLSIRYNEIQNSIKHWVTSRRFLSWSIKKNYKRGKGCIWHRKVEYFCLENITYSKISHIAVLIAMSSCFSNIYNFKLLSNILSEFLKVSWIFLPNLSSPWKIYRSGYIGYIGYAYIVDITKMYIFP